ncbi:Nif3-like dinuclear metal center hexameric protein [Methanolapillus ohkumae]|uniref:GTP cyclohydrolase 1 type 2 n=1 Tax=Methanolapillus ohkumae TaxID=3028298 RepID=A0AA96V4W0_9EURY|nr:GTP cyclohydrolase 1 type 2 [Methanosarcinaceae archaeon Am2]
MDQKDFINILETIAPPELAADFDVGRIGLVVDLLYEKNRQIQKVAVSLDVTPEVLQKAAEFQADLLICHHTPIFHPVTQINRSLAEKLKIIFDHNISIYAMHTNYDRACGGINDVLAARLHLENVEKCDAGIIGTVPVQSSEDFARFVSGQLKTPLIYAGSKTIRKVFICGGSCFNRETLKAAKENGVDAFISSELKHSDILRERGDITLIDAGHYATENPGMEELPKKIQAFLVEKLGNAEKIEILFIDDNPGIQSIP